MEKDYYKILRVSKTATQEEIRKSYRELCKKMHPDSDPNNPNLEKNFKEINEAYEVLGDANKRANYDNGGRMPFNFDNIRNGGFSFDINDLFNGFGNFNTSTFNRPTQGSDIRINITLTFEESIDGCTKEVQINKIDNCDVCNGSGSKIHSQINKCSVCRGTGQETKHQQTMVGMTSIVMSTCSACKGKGKVITDPCDNCHGNGNQQKTKKLEIKIPAGIDENQTIILRDMGNVGSNNGPNGNLLVSVSIKPHEFFKRQGLNIYFEYPMSFVQATLGDTIEILNIHGEKETIEIKQGTQNNDKISIKNGGVNNPNNINQKGDLIVIFKLQTPTNLTDRQKEILRQFDQEGNI